MIFLIGAIVQSFLPWWTIAIAAAIPTIFIKNKPYLSFIAGFVGIGLLWATYAWWLDGENASLLSSQIGEIFNGLSSEMLVFTTGFVGGLVGGFSAMTVGILRQLVKE